MFIGGDVSVSRQNETYFCLLHTQIFRRSSNPTGRSLIQLQNYFGSSHRGLTRSHRTRLNVTSQILVVCLRDVCTLLDSCSSSSLSGIDWFSLVFTSFSRIMLSVSPASQRSHFWHTDTNKTHFNQTRHSWLAERSANELLSLWVVD